MGIRFACHACGKPLNIKQDLAGRRGVCPECKTRFRIPLKDAERSQPLEREMSGSGVESHSFEPTQTANAGIESDSAVATMTEPPKIKARANLPEILTGEEPATWYVRPPSGGQYGPAETNVLCEWIDEGRVAKTALLWRDGWPQWREAADVLPEMAEKLPGDSEKAPAMDQHSRGKTKSIAIEKTSPIDKSFAGAAKIGATRRKRTNHRITLVAILLALVVGLVVTLFLVASTRG